MSGIFISYRRDDAEGWVTGLAHALRERFGADQVFRDIDTLSPGLSYTEAIERRLAQSDVVLVIIGPRWLAATDKAGRRRLDDPKDLARLEVATVLRRQIPVVPVLVGRASMPTAEDLPEELQELTHRHAYDLSDRRWDYDLEELIRILEGPAYLGVPARHDPPCQPSRPIPDSDSIPTSAPSPGLHAGHGTTPRSARRVAMSYLIYGASGFGVFVASAALIGGLADVLWPTGPETSLLKDMLTVLAVSGALYVVLVRLVRKIDALRGESSFGRLIALVSLPVLFMFLASLDSSPETADAKMSFLTMLVILVCMPFLINRRALPVSTAAAISHRT